MGVSEPGGSGMMFDLLKKTVLDIISENTGPVEKLQAVCDALSRGRPSYDWTGYYLVDKSRERELVLGPFTGDSTDHTRIGFGEGICGQAADTLQVFVIDDVNAESNYLSCSPDVRSEFVAPVIWNGTLVGELDLDSHTVSAFSEDDSEFLLWVAEVTAPAVAGAAGFGE